jgi:hypothetical protein
LNAKSDPQNQMNVNRKRICQEIPSRFCAFFRNQRRYKST